MPSKPLLTVIVARARNGVIGRDNAMPWHLPSDLKYFKQQTLGKVIVMGRKTFESIGRPLPGRANVVVTRSEDYQAEGIHVVHSVEEALDAATRLAAEQGLDTSEVAMIGGAELYRQAMPLAGRLLVTEVQAEPEGDAWFEAPDPRSWQEVSRRSQPADGKNEYPHDFVEYERQWYAQ